jgi:hypothetical protein
VPGWKAYFRLAQTPTVMRELDAWLRHRLRAVQLKQWRRGPTIFRELRKLGADRDLAGRVAGNARRWWRNSRMGLNRVLPIAYFDRLGVGSPAILLTSTSRTARCGPACRVVWEGPGQR